MGTIESYLRWRGDLTLVERPFGEVDNLVLSELSYLDWNGLVPSSESGGSVAVSDLIEPFRVLGRGNVCMNGPDLAFLEAFAASKRFGGCKLSHFSEVLDEATQTQFAALMVTLEDGTRYIAFRGTGDELVGWREDFSMSYQIMPAQHLAADYLRGILAQTDGSYLIGGHSKGGNLAVYASLACWEEYQDRILCIYSNDGPGLCPDLIDMKHYQELQKKLVRIVPEFCIVGALFEQEAPTMIVRSCATGPSQHEGTSWLVEGDHFVTCQTLSSQCKVCNEIFDEWLVGANMEQREIFTRDFFDALGAGGARKMSEITARGLDGFESILIAIAQSENRTKLLLGRLIQNVLNRVSQVNFLQLLKQKGTVQSIVCLLLGLGFLAQPSLVAQCVGLSVGLATLFWAGRHLLQCAMQPADNEVEKQIKLIVHMVLMCVLSALICQIKVLQGFTNLILCVCFFAFAFSALRTARERQGMMRILMIVAAAFSFMLGVVPIATTVFAMSEYAFVAGTFLTMYGAATFGYQVLHPVEH